MEIDCFSVYMRTTAKTKDLLYKILALLKPVVKLLWHSVGIGHHS